MKTNFVVIKLPHFNFKNIRRDYNASFDIALSCEKENFDLAELSSVIDELVEKLENAPKIEFLD